MDKKNFGEMIRKYRKFRGYKLQEVADAVHLSSGEYVGKYESGNRTPSIETIIEIANLLHISMDTLLHHSLDIFKDVPEEDDLISHVQLLSPNEKRHVMALMKEMIGTRMNDFDVIDTINSDKHSD